MEKGMSEGQTRRLIEWLKTQGVTAEKIVECFEFINTKQKEKGSDAPTK